MPDAENVQALRLFQYAWELLARLEEQKRLLPEPQPPTERGPLPPHWDDSLRYAYCLERLRQSLSATLNVIVNDLGRRQEFHLQRGLLPPERRT